MTKKKETSDMSNIGIIRQIDDIPELKAELITVFENKNKKEISIYGLQLIQHVLKLTGIQPCDAITECIEVSRSWQKGIATYQETRQAAAKIPDLVRTEQDPVRTIVLKVAGQVTLIPHVKRHGLIASEFAVTLVNLLHPKDMEEVRKERLTQIELMTGVNSGID